MREVIVDIGNNETTLRDFTPEEIANIEEGKYLHVLEKALQPSLSEISEAEFEIKLIEKLIEWGILV